MQSARELDVALGLFAPELAPWFRGELAYQRLTAWRVTIAGAPVGWVLWRIEHDAGRRTFVVVAAFGASRAFDLTHAVYPAIELRAKALGCVMVRVAHLPARPRRQAARSRLRRRRVGLAQGDRAMSAWRNVALFGEVPWIEGEPARGCFGGGGSSRSSSSSTTTETSTQYEEQATTEYGPAASAGSTASETNYITSLDPDVLEEAVTAESRSGGGGGDRGQHRDRDQRRAAARRSSMPRSRPRRTC